MSLDAMDLEIEPDQPEAAPVASSDAISPVLVEVLGAEVALPVLAKWVPDTRLRDAAAGVVAVASMVDVTTAEGFVQADAVLGDLRACQKAIADHFLEPKTIAYRLHRRITGIEGEWLTPGADALKALGDRLYKEQQRHEREAAEARRKVQEEADRNAREAAERDAQAAAAAQAPKAVVEDLAARAKTATAAPVQPFMPAPKLSSSSAVTTWKARLAATTGDREPNPDIADLNAAERANVLELLRAILDEKAPLQAISLNWSYLNTRAKADKSTLTIAGVSPFETGGLRGKGGRRA